MGWIFAFAIFSIQAVAAEPDATNSQSRFDWANALKRVGGNYGALLLGPTLQHPDGNLDGKGANISLRNYLSLDVKVTPEWEVETGGELRQTWRPVDPKKPNRKNLEARDPYVGIARKDIYRGDIFSLGARARYFIPVTDHNKSKVGKPEDSGNGSTNFSLKPAWKFLDGDLYVACSFDAYYNIPERAPAVREDYSLRARPLISYRIVKKFAAKVEYDSGILRHSTNGKWTKFNDRFTGQRLFVGGSWSPTSAFGLSPSLSWGSHTFRLNRAEVSLFANYKFL